MFGLLGCLQEKIEIREIGWIEEKAESDVSLLY